MNSGHGNLRVTLLEAGIVRSGHFVFASGNHGLVKLEMDEIWHHPKALEAVLQALAAAKGLAKADVIMGVPTGGQRLAEVLREKGYSHLPIARLERIPNGKKQDFRFCTPLDEKLALSAITPLIYEDVVTTLSSIAGVARLLDPVKQNIHSLAIWRRGKIESKSQIGLRDHYLIEAEFPIYTPENCPHCI